jgi:hypothetical protein
MIRKGASKQKSNPARGPIARKVITAARETLRQKVTNLADWREGKLRAEEDQKTIVSRERLSKHDPLHAVYIYAQNQLSVLIEQLGSLPALDKLTEPVAAADEEYMPSGPPMSPLTMSYFTSWSAFDLCTRGAKPETLCTVATDFCRAQGVDEGLLAVFEAMQASRMGVYRHEGTSERYVLLRELVTNREIKAISTSGYRGRRGELWFVCVLPPLFDESAFDYSVVFTTPYLLGTLGPSGRFVTDVEDDWLAFFDRTLGKSDAAARAIAYERFMKYGPSRNYWNEYVFLAYRNHREDVIFLEGIPDRPESLPHSDLGRGRFGF